MKQHITKEQWDELSKNQHEKLYQQIYKDAGAQMGTNIFGTDYQEINIGFMIEFIGVGLNRIDIDPEHNSVSLNYNEWEGESPFEEENFCDSLWEAVKYKLKK